MKTFKVEYIVPETGWLFSATAHPEADSEAGIHCFIETDDETPDYVFEILQEQANERIRRLLAPPKKLRASKETIAPTAYDDEDYTHEEAPINFDDEDYIHAAGEDLYGDRAR